MRRWRVSGVLASSMARTCRRRLLYDRPSKKRRASASASRAAAKSGGTTSTLRLGVELDVDVELVTAGDARLLPDVGADPHHEHTAHDRDRAAVGVALDRDPHRRPLARPQGLDDLGRHLDPGGGLVALQQRGSKSHARLTLPGRRTHRRPDVSIRRRSVVPWVAMARIDQRDARNADGPWFVDTRCIDCGTCRDLVPELFAAVRRPVGRGRAARRARRRAPGVAGGRGVPDPVDRAHAPHPRPPGLYPLHVDGPVYDLGHTSRTPSAPPATSCSGPRGTSWSTPPATPGP